MDEELKAAVDGIIQLRPEKLDLEKDPMDDRLRRQVLCPGTSLSQALKEDEVIDVLGPSSMKPITTNSYHDQQLQSSIPPPSSLLHACHIQGSASPSFPSLTTTS